MRIPTNNDEIQLEMVSRGAMELVAEVKAELAHMDATLADPGLAATDYNVRKSAWTIQRPPDPLLNRRIEIMGPPDPAAVEAGLKSGANVYVADMALAQSRGFEEVDPLLRSLARYAASMGDTPRAPVLMVRPRPLCENNDVNDGARELVLFAFYYAHLCDETPQGPYFYLPDVSSRACAMSWNVALDAVLQCGVLENHELRTTAEICRPSGVVGAEEILWEHRRHTVGMAIRCVDDMVSDGIETVTLECGGDVRRSRIRELVSLCSRRNAQIICGVKKGVPLRVGQEGLTVSLARVVPAARELAFA